MERIVINRAVRLVLMLVIVPGFVLLDHFLRVHKLGRNGQRKFQHGFVPGGGGFLRKKSDGSVLLNRHRSLIGRNITEQKSKQRRFASAIGANQSEPVAAIDLERYVIEERPPRERFRKL